MTIRFYKQNGTSTVMNSDCYECFTIQNAKDRIIQCPSPLEIPAPTLVYIVIILLFDLLSCRFRTVSLGMIQ
jgi:hypothetical protein